MKTFIQVAVYILLVAGVAAVVFYIYSFVKNGQQDFYVQYGAERISGETNVELKKDAYSMFSCGKVLSFGEDSGVADFTVRLELNPEY